MPLNIDDIRPLNLNPPLTYFCPHCKKPFQIQLPYDPEAVKNLIKWVAQDKDFSFAKLLCLIEELE